MAQYFPRRAARWPRRLCCLDVVAMRASGDVSGSALSALAPLGLGCGPNRFTPITPYPSPCCFWKVSPSSRSRCVCRPRDLARACCPRAGVGAAPRAGAYPAGLCLPAGPSQNLAVVGCPVLYRRDVRLGDGRYRIVHASNETYRRCWRPPAPRTIYRKALRDDFGIYAAIA